MRRVDEHYRINFVEWARLPFMDLRQNFISNVADEALENFKAVQFLNCVGNLARTQATSVHRDNFSVNVENIPFVASE